MYTTLKEIEILGKKLKAGSLVTKSTDGYYKDITNKFIFDSEIVETNTDTFRKQTFTIEEVRESDVKKHWRVQLDVKCNMVKLKKIQLFLEENIGKILDE